MFQPLLAKSSEVLARFGLHTHLLASAKAIERRNAKSFQSHSRAHPPAQEAKILNHNAFGNESGPQNVQT
jgi:hypothetical protein